MRQVFIRTVIKGLGVLVGILVISTALGFLIHVRGADKILELRGSQISSADPTQERDEAIAYINEFLGFNRPFIPDLWPFDNESFWHKAEKE